MYRCFLYKKIEGKVVSKIFDGEEATEAGRKDGWMDTPAAFVNTVEDIPLDQREALKAGANHLAEDVNLALNCDKIDSIHELKAIYKRLSGKDMHKRVSTLKGAQAAVKSLLGDTENGENS